MKDPPVAWPSRMQGAQSWPCIRHQERERPTKGPSKHCLKLISKRNFFWVRRRRKAEAGGRNTWDWNLVQSDVFWMKKETQKKNRKDGSEVETEGQSSLEQPWSVRLNGEWNCMFLKKMKEQRRKFTTHQSNGLQIMVERSRSRRRWDFYRHKTGSNQWRWEVECDMVGQSQTIQMEQYDWFSEMPRGTLRLRSRLHFFSSYYCLLVYFYFCSKI